MELMHLPKFQMIGVKSKVNKYLADPEKNPVPVSSDSAYESSEDTGHESPSSYQRNVRSPTSDYGTSSSLTSYTELDHEEIIEIVDRLSLITESGGLEQPSEQPEDIESESLGTMHGADNSNIFVKIRVEDPDADAVSLDDELAEVSLETERQTVELPMLWDLTPVPVLSSQSESTESFVALQKDVNTDDDYVVVFKGAIENYGPGAVQDVMEDISVRNGCLESSRRQLWHLVSTCRDLLNV